MQASPQPIVKDLVLIGGGHSHAIALKKFGMAPIPGVQITLISNVVNTPYSGMLPGYVAGLYRFEDCHIDLRPLAQFARARLILDRAVGLDLANNRVLLADRPPIAFDILSIDIGSTPATLTIPGAAEYTIPVKPISQFLHYWDDMVDAVAQHPIPRRLAVVGGGAGGVELALSVQSRLQRIYQDAHVSPDKLELHLFHRGAQLLPERSSWIGHRLQQILTRRGIQLHLQETVTAIETDVEPDKAEAEQAAAFVQPIEKRVHCESGLTVACDRIFWVTQASAASWLADSGLATDDRGFVQVGDTLQSVSHPQVFAAGDVATMVNHPRPKAGVFAVRQGKPLFQNLRRALLEQPLQPFVPQQQFLILVGTGDRQAIASRGRIGFGPHPLIWKWKDVLDRQFMDQFSHLAPMSQSQPPRSQPASRLDSQPSTSPMRCAGCGSKVGSSILERVLDRIRQEQPEQPRDDILIGLEAADDAAVVSVPVGQVMVQTIDHFRALLDDPFLFGQICTHHCLSDIFAMGATPQSALAIATLPYATDDKLEETLYQLLSGTVTVLHQAQALLVGGHTTEAAELSFGLACNGLVSPELIWRKAGMKPGQVLILTKALGTGTLFAADMRLKAKGSWIETAIQSMLRSNQAAATCLRQYGATACTDITGFGLLGHLLEMVRASQVAIELDLNALPVLDGARETIGQGIVSSLHPQNLQASRFVQNLEAVCDRPLYPLLFDPQTSGGLLASVPTNQATLCLTALKAADYPHSQIIGRVLPLQQGNPITITP
jgi:selenide,water dikinase